MSKLNFPLQKIKEGSAEIFIPIEKKISKKLPVFYNPVMKLNRDIAILLLKQFAPLSLCDPLAGTGIRAIRFSLELKNKSVIANDINENAFLLIKKNVKHDKVNFEMGNKDANIFLLEHKNFDYIDIDPFGSPNPFLDSAVKRLARNGILAVTATDTSALCGTHVDACLRKYWAIPKRDSLMKEMAIRILIRKIQLIGAQYEKALIPIFSYSHEHYFRTFLQSKKSKSAADKILKKHCMFNEAGPLWTGALWDSKLALKIYNAALEDDLYNKDRVLLKLLKTIKGESKIDAVGFFDIHYICKKNRIKTLPKKELVAERIKKLGYRVSDTHFSPAAIRSDISGKELIRIIKND